MRLLKQEREDVKKGIYSKIVSWTWLGCVLVIYALFLWNKIHCLIDSDMSSELILGNILSKEHGILTDKWFYSTELRFLNTQLVYKLVFVFSNNWRIVRCVSSVFLMIVLLSCFYYMMYQLECKKFFPLLSPFLIWNYSNEYFVYISRGLYYIPHVCISFLTIGMLWQCVKSSNKLQKYLVAVLMAVLALFAGMGGPRQIIILYLPILLSAVIWFIVKKDNGEARKKVQYMILCSVNFIFSVAGYFINSKILSHRFQFMIFEIHYKEFSLESLVQAFNGILRIFGYSDGKIFSFATVLNGCMFLVIIMMIVSIYIGVTRKDETASFGASVSFYLLCATVINTLLYAFTDMPYEDRYYLPIVVFAIPVIALNIGEVSCNLQAKKIICTLVIFLVYACGVRKLYVSVDIDVTAQIREVTNYLLDKNVVNGYSTYWNGNVMTELSNGKIEVWATYETENLFRKDDNLFRWLQLKDHIDCKPEGKIFVLLSREEYASCLQEVLSPEDAAFSNTNYVLYVFNSYDEFAELLEEHT